MALDLESVRPYEAMLTVLLNSGVPVDPGYRFVWTILQKAKAIDRRTAVIEIRDRLSSYVYRRSTLTKSGKINMIIETIFLDEISMVSTFKVMSISRKFIKTVMNTLTDLEPDLYSYGVKSDINKVMAIYRLEFTKIPKTLTDKTKHVEVVKSML